MGALVNPFMVAPGGSPPDAPAAPTNAYPTAWLGNNGINFTTPALPAGTTDTTFAIDVKQDAGSWISMGGAFPPSTADNYSGEVFPPPPFADDLATMSQNASQLSLRLQGCSNGFGTGPASAAVECLLPASGPITPTYDTGTDILAFDTPAMASGATNASFRLWYNADGGGWIDTGNDYGPSLTGQTEAGIAEPAVDLIVRFGELTNGTVNSATGSEVNVTLI